MCYWLHEYDITCSWTKFCKGSPQASHEAHGPISWYQSTFLGMLSNYLRNICQSTKLYLKFRSQTQSGKCFCQCPMRDREKERHTEREREREKERERERGRKIDPDPDPELSSVHPPYTRIGFNHYARSIQCIYAILFLVDVLPLLQMCCRRYRHYTPTQNTWVSVWTQWYSLLIH